MSRAGVVPAFSACAIAVLLLSSRAPAEGTLLREQAFALEAAAEVTATVTAGCDGCDWGRRGREAAALELRVDGRYSQHLLLPRGAQSAPYRVALGRLEKGKHRLSITFDRERSASGIATASVSALVVAPSAAGSDEERGLAHAPVLHARPNTLGRFSDVPLVMWYEREATPRGARLRYSVVFSNEDGGTPPDRLMATWGRLTDIEFVYGVELDQDGRVLAQEYQGREHKIQPFAGAREALHPLLFVVTDNNMLADRGEPTLRLAPAPEPFELRETSREAVMDANPWTYQVSVREVRREGRVGERARPGDKTIPDPRRFATLEACAPAQDATLAFSIGVRSGEGGVRWFDSDAGLPNFRIARRPHEFPTGCFRGAVALPAGTQEADLVGLRFRAFTRLPGKDEPPLPKGAGSARLLRVNTLFLLGQDDLPGTRLLTWQGDVSLAAEGPAYEIAVKRRSLQ
jgi:hypothetical protein